MSNPNEPWETEGDEWKDLERANADPPNPYGHLVTYVGGPRDGHTYCVPAGVRRLSIPWIDHRGRLSAMRYDIVGNLALYMGTEV